MRQITKVLLFSDCFLHFYVEGTVPVLLFWIWKSEQCPQDDKNSLGWVWLHQKWNQERGSWGFLSSLTQQMGHRPSPGKNVDICLTMTCLVSLRNLILTADGLINYKPHHLAGLIASGLVAPGLGLEWKLPGESPRLRTRAGAFFLDFVLHGDYRISRWF
jgi:hypothetical protein